MLSLRTSRIKNLHFWAFWLLLSVALNLFSVSLLHGQLRNLNINFVRVDTSNKSLFADDFPDKSAILVRTEIQNISFESNLGLIDVLPFDSLNSQLLIIDPVTQIITVNSPGFIEGRFRVGNMPSGSIFEYNIDTPETDTVLTPVVFQIRPLEATLYVNDEPVNFNSPVILVDGLHEIEIKAEGFKTLKDTILVNNTNSFFEFNLDLLIKEVVRLRTIPSEAAVYLDDIQIGTTPYDNFFYPGDYSLRLTKEGYITISEEITVKSDLNNLFEYELEKLITRLRLLVEPSDAELFINNTPANHNSTIELKPGVFSLLIQREGYEAFQEQITLKAGETLERTINLRMKPGILQLRVMPVDAEVDLIDSNGDILNNWVGTNILRDIPEGSYTIFVSSEGYNSKSVQIVIQENKITGSEIILDKITTSNSGVLDVSVSPDSAEIQLLDISGTIIESWRGSNRLENVRAGNYTVKALFNGFNEEAQSIRISDGFTTNVEFDLSEATETTQQDPIESGVGELQIRINPSNATVELMDRYGLSVMNWVGSSNLNNIPSGSYKVLIKAEGYEEMVVPFTIIPNKITPLNVQLIEINDEIVYEFAEVMPELIGGLAALQSQINYPPYAKRARIEGTVYVEFIVNEKGDVEAPTVLKGIGGGCDEEAIRAISLMRFKPGIRSGKPVKIKLSVPIIFKLES